MQSLYFIQPSKAKEKHQTINTKRGIILSAEVGREMTFPAVCLSWITALCLCDIQLDEIFFVTGAERTCFLRVLLRTRLCCCHPQNFLSPCVVSKPHFPCSFCSYFVHYQIYISLEFRLSGRNSVKYVKKSLFLCFKYWLHLQNNIKYERVTISETLEKQTRISKMVADGLFYYQ